MQDTGKFRTNTKDQFYTLRDVATTCVRRIYEHVPEVAHWTWIEPSAGAGAFLASAPEGSIGIDIEVAGDGIAEADFLTWTVPTTGRPILVFGNPPFGRQSSLAKAFIAKSCQFADAIAFILPRSFVKPSMQRAFEAHFHCIVSEPVQDNAFTINGSPYNVPCVFQIWRRMAVPRPAPTTVEPAGFAYVRADQPHNLIVRRVGAHAGRAHVPDGTTTFSVQSHHFIALADGIDAAAVAAALNEVEFPTNTTGPRSLSKSEINDALNAAISSVECAYHQSD